MKEARFVGRLSDWRGVPLVAVYEDGDEAYIYDHIWGSWSRCSDGAKPLQMSIFQPPNAHIVYTLWNKSLQGQTT